MSKLSIFNHYPLLLNRYTILHPIRMLKDIKYTLRDAWQRITKGYSCYDVWGMSEWMLIVLADMFEELRTTGHGYPGFAPFDTPEKWDAHLKDIVERLKLLQEENWELQNEYSDAFFEESDKCRRESKDEVTGGMRITWANTPDYEELKEKFFHRADELAKERKRLLLEVGTLIFTNFDNYWD